MASEVFVALSALVLTPVLFVGIASFGWRLCVEAFSHTTLAQHLALFAGVAIFERLTVSPTIAYVDASVHAFYAGTAPIDVVHAIAFAILVLGAWFFLVLTLGLFATVTLRSLRHWYAK